MVHDASGKNGPGHVYLQEAEKVRVEFEAASHQTWIELSSILGRRWENPNLARMAASRRVQDLSDLAKLRCLPDGRPLPAAAVFDALHARVTNYGRTPETVVESHLIRGLAGEARSTLTAADITAKIQQFLQCYSAEYERGELKWVDDLYAMAVPGNRAPTWTLKVPPIHETGEDAVVTLQIPVAVLNMAGLLTGDQLILEPRFNGLWIGH